MINKVHNGDCIKLMAGMPQVDLIFADPPYNAKDIGPNQRTYSEGRMQLPEKEYKQFCKDWFDAAQALCPRIIMTPGIGNTHNYPQPKWQVCWHKPAAVSFNRLGGFNAWEPIFIYGTFKGKNICPQDYVLVNTCNFKKGPEKDHPCPKPLNLMIWIIERFSKEGDVVLDPMCGAGTTLVACEILHRRWIGIEKIKKYCEISMKRVKAEQNQIKFK